MTGITSGTSGVIAADNGQEILILAEDSVCEGAVEWTVTFQDGKQYSASLKMQDKNTGLVMFSVSRGEIADINMVLHQRCPRSAISNLVTQGDTVMALGNMFGYADGWGTAWSAPQTIKKRFLTGNATSWRQISRLSHRGRESFSIWRGEVIGLIRRPPGMIRRALW